MVIVGLGGSLRERSRSRAMLREALRVAAERGAQTELLDVRELALPMFEPDWGAEEYSAGQRPAVERLLAGFRSADAMIWASPCYHGTISGAVKNALDFVELLDEDERPYLTGRAIGLIAVNDSTTWAAMRDCVHELRAWLAPTAITVTGRDFTPQLELTSERARRRIERMVDELMSFRRD